MKVPGLFRSCLKFSGLCILFFLITAPNLHAQPTKEAGKTLFKNQCGSCHNKNMKDDMTGPALAGVEERWADYPVEDLYSWIRNAPAMINDGHPRATELWNQWKPAAMTAFSSFTDEDIQSLLLYINDPGVPLAAGPSGIEVKKSSQGNYLYYLMFAILAVVAALLARIISNLNYINERKENPDVNITRKSLLETFTSKGVIGFLVFGLIVLMGYTTVTNGVDLGRQQGYAPDQPIKFSHATHAGINGIDCQYCHDGARRSKHSVIPSTNTCMNCHRAIKKGSIDGTAELTKVFASIGYNPSNDSYIDNYESLSEDTIKAIYTKWITDEFLKDENISALNRKGEREVEDQWKNIKESLTNPQKTQVQGPIEWTRIHHLPDHVYFSHAQHVTVGKLECQQCHGKVEEMEVMQQYSPLSMGWCINCHRETEVKFTDNAYYNSYAKYHEALSSGDMDKVTVEDIGGLECQKCHY